MSEPRFTAASIEEYFGLKSHWVSTLPGERIHYIDEGQGTPVILIHGSAVGITAAANFYLNIPPLLAAGYRVLAPDLHGYGWTETPAEVTPGHDAWTDEIVRFMDALGIEQAYLVGNSLGGRISVLVSLKIPDRILGNVVIGNGGAKWPDARKRGQGASREDVTTFTRESVRDAVMHFIENPEMVSERLVDYRAQMAALPGAGQRHAWVTRLRNLSRSEPLDVEAARRCPVPTLVIYGREDTLGPPENALALAEAFPNADLVVFGHCGHWAQVERVDEFNALLLRFVGGYSRRMVSPPVRARDLRGGDLDRDDA